MLHGGSVPDGGLAGGLRHRDGSDASDRSVLAGAVRDFDRTKVPGVCGECAAHQESAGAENGCARVSVAVEVAYPRFVEQFISPERRDLRFANLLAPTS